MTFSLQSLWRLWKSENDSRLVMSNSLHSMDCSLPDSSVHGILQARILEWVAIPFSRGSSQSKDWTQDCCIAGRFFSVCPPSWYQMAESPIINHIVSVDYLAEHEVKSLSCPQLFVTPWTVACTKLLHPWDFLGKSTGVGCRFLLQGIFPTQGLNPGLPHCRQTLYHVSHQGSIVVEWSPYYTTWMDEKQM